MNEYVTQNYQFTWPLSVSASAQFYILRETFDGCVKPFNELIIFRYTNYTKMTCPAQVRVENLFSRYWKRQWASNDTNLHQVTRFQFDYVLMRASGAEPLALCPITVTQFQAGLSQVGFCGDHLWTPSCSSFCFFRSWKKRKLLYRNAVSEKTG